MIHDALLELASSLSIEGTDLATDTVDQLAAGGSFDQDLWLVVRVGVSFADGTSINFQLQSDSAAAFNVAAITHAQSGAVAVAALTAGSIVWRQKLPHDMKRYIRVWCDVTGTMSNVGRVNIFITPDIDYSFGKRY
jgi:hypothetical protein